MMDTLIWSITGGAAITAKEEGLWDPIGHVTREEIRHMQARVGIHRATHVAGEKSDNFDHSPACGSSWCRWVVVDSVAFASRQPPRPFPGRACRQSRRPAALPALGSTQPTEPHDSRSGDMTANQKDRSARNREEAVQRKLRKRQKEAVVLPEVDEEEEDPMGHGNSLGK